MSDSNDQMPEPAPSGGEGGPVQAVIRKFGGIRPMAGKLEIAFTTVQGWKQRGHIPPSQHRRILDAATAHGIALTPDELGPDRPAPLSSLPYALRQREGVRLRIDPEFLEMGAKCLEHI